EVAAAARAAAQALTAGLPARRGRRAKVGERDEPLGIDLPLALLRRVFVRQLLPPRREGSLTWTGRDQVEPGLERMVDRQRLGAQHLQPALQSFRVEALRQAGRSGPAAASGLRGQ